MKLTRAQKQVLQRLAAGGWVLDMAGRDGCQGWMSGPRKEQHNISAQTMSALLDGLLITTSVDGISDYEITQAGRMAVEDSN